MLRYAISAGQSNLPGLYAQAEQLAADGVDFFQLREKDLPVRQLAVLTRDILEILAGSHTRLLLNAGADIAAATGCDGVHLTAALGGLTPDQIRSLYDGIGLRRPIVSQSTHTLAEVTQARRWRPDLILFSPIFGKRIGGVELLPAVGLEQLSRACVLAHPIPVLALGGVNASNLLGCMGAGAAGVAGVRLFFRTAPGA
jgi:thiamine-phosphate pyrophosphorylase